MKITEERVREALHFRSLLHPYTKIFARDSFVFYSSSKAYFILTKERSQAEAEDLARSIAYEVFNSNYPLVKAREIAKQYKGEPS